MNLGMPEMIFIFLLALIIFGPKKLPEIGRQLGRALTEFRRASNEFKSQLEAEIRDLEIDQNTIAPPPITPQGAVAYDNSYHEGPVPSLPESGNGHSVTPDPHSIPPAQGYDA